MEGTYLFTQLKNLGVRATPQRRAICQYLAGSREHPTAQQVYEALHRSFPSMSKTTVYNTLETLAQAGLIQAFGSPADKTTHYETDPAPHVNLLCVSCGKITDTAHPGVEALWREIEKEVNQPLIGGSVQFNWVCPGCGKEKLA